MLGMLHECMTTSLFSKIRLQYLQPMSAAAVRPDFRKGSTDEFKSEHKEPEIAMVDSTQSVLPSYSLGLYDISGFVQGM